MTDTLIPPNAPDALAKLAEIPAVGSEELERLSAAVGEFIFAEEAEERARVKSEETVEALKNMTRVNGATEDDVRAGIECNRAAHEEVMAALHHRQCAEAAMKDAVRAAYRSGNLLAPTGDRGGRQGAAGFDACHQAARRAADQMSWAKPQSPTRSSPSEDGMTVEEAREIIEGLSWYSAHPQRYADVCRDLGKYTRASEIERALRTLQDNGEVR